MGSMSVKMEAKGWEGTWEQDMMEAMRPRARSLHGALQRQI